jgi:hypothetical protein
LEFGAHSSIEDDDLFCVEKRLHVVHVAPFLVQRKTLRALKEPSPAIMTTEAAATSQRFKRPSSFPTQKQALQAA